MPVLRDTAIPSQNLHPGPVEPEVNSELSQHPWKTDWNQRSQGLPGPHFSKVCLYRMRGGDEAPTSMAEHTGGRWSPLLKSKMQIEATVISSPPSRPYPHLVLPSLPKCGHCLSKSDLPPQQQGGPTPRSKALSSFLRDCGHNQSGAHRPCNTSLRLMWSSRLSPPPWSWSRPEESFLLQLPSPGI